MGRAAKEEQQPDGLTRAAFPGEIVVVDTPEELQTCLAELQNEHLLGFDTESKPQFVKGKGQNAVALVQLCTLRKAWLIRTCCLGGLPSGIADVLADPATVKVGLSVHDDAKRLGIRLGHTARGFVDLAHVAAQYGLEERGLRGLCARVLGFHLSKGAQLSNWESEVLAPRQLQYAATDAWVSLLLYLDQAFRSVHHGDLTPLKEFILTSSPEKKTRKRTSQPRGEETLKPKKTNRRESKDSANVES